MEVREHEEAVDDVGVNLYLSGPETIQCKCIICKLLARGFSDLPLEEKREIIIKGRPTPSLVNLSKQTKSFVRHFQTDNYKKCEWLTGCEYKSLLFCWPCILFSSEKNMWNKNGFSDLNNLHKLIKRHGSSKNHIHAIIKEKTFCRISAAHALDDQLRISTEKHNQEVRENREIIKRLIDVVCFLGQHELAFRGHTESQNSLNKGNYVDLLNLLAKYDKTLKSHLENSTRFKGTSNLIQNELLLCVEKTILKKIRTEIEEASAVAIILDETMDIFNISQLSKVVRYVTRTGNIKERFLGFHDICTKRSAEDLYSIVDNLVEELGCSSKLVAQSYDGAAVMAGELGRLQTKVKEKFPSALLVHCMAHHLNLVLQQSLNNKNECRVFFSTLRGLADFFSKSSRRTNCLNLEVNKRLPKVAPTRWNYNGRLVQTVLKYREPLIDFFYKILDNPEEWDNETIVCSRGYLDILERDANFIFLLLVFSEIFPSCDNLFSVLQNRTSNINFCVKKIQDFKLKVSLKRDQFENFWKKFQELTTDTQPPRKRIRSDVVGEQVDEKARRLFFEIIDNVVIHIETRFKDFSTLKFLELVNFNKNTSISGPAFDSLKQSYPDHFDFAALRSELSVIYNTSEGLNKKGAIDLLKSLKECGLDRACPETVKLCELTLTIPVTSASSEPSFSVLKRIKNFMRNSTGQERLSALGLLSIEKELLQEMTREEQFYQDVIDEFAKVSRRIPLTFKLANNESTSYSIKEEHHENNLSSIYHTDPIHSQPIELMPSGVSYSFKEENCESDLSSTSQAGLVHSQHIDLKPSTIPSKDPFRQDQDNNIDEAVNAQITSIKILKEENDDDERNFEDQEYVESISYSFNENYENVLSPNYHVGDQHIDPNYLTKEVEDETATITSFHSFSQ